MRIRDLKPGMSRVDINVKVLEVLESQEIMMSDNVKHEILELKVGDETESIALVLWDDKMMRNLQAGTPYRLRKAS